MIHYIYNTRGEYVAYIYDGIYCFSRENSFIGQVLGRDLYDKGGNYIGSLSYDDRIIKLRGVIKPKIPAIKAPIAPMKPMRPLKRLSMPPVGSEYEDVFMNARFNNGKHGNDYAWVLGSKLYASDGVYLGDLDLNKYNSNSIANPYGPYGSQYSANSIFNQYGEYGSKYSSKSPFNQYSAGALFAKANDGRILAHISDNRYLGLTNLISATDFFDWFRAQIGA